MSDNATEATEAIPPVTEETAVMPVVPETEVLEPLPESPFAGASETGLMRADGPAPADEPAPPAETPDGPCRCGTCGAQPEPGKDALLYYGPGIATRMWETRIRNGQWTDIAAEFNDAHARIHLPTLKRNGEIHLDISTGAYALAAVFGTHPEARSDEDLTEGLASAVVSYEAELAKQQTYLHYETLRRIAALRDDLTEDEAEEVAA
jgi:hypothetical protein